MQKPGLADKRGMQMLRRIVDFALPPRCPACGAVVPGDGAFCAGCWQQLEFLGEPCCARCALPFPYAQGEGALCGGCLEEAPYYDRLRAAVAYGEIARGVALKLKYGGRPGVARQLAGLMQRHLEAGDDPLLVPVPLHRWRIWRRGYNQAALIAEALAQRDGIDVDLFALERTKATPVLKGLGRAARLRAVRGAFRMAPGAEARIAGRNVALIDDVYTTGATANACAGVLRRAGAARIEVLTWARVVREGTD